jgi:hypothetical protein
MKVRRLLLGLVAIAASLTALQCVGRDIVEDQVHLSPFVNPEDDDGRDALLGAVEAKMNNEKGAECVLAVFHEELRTKHGDTFKPTKNHENAPKSAIEPLVLESLALLRAAPAGGPRDALLGRLQSGLKKELDTRLELAYGDTGFQIETKSVEVEYVEIEGVVWCKIRGQLIPKAAAAMTSYDVYEVPLKGKNVRFCATFEWIAKKL